MPRAKIDILKDMSLYAQSLEGALEFNDWAWAKRSALQLFELIRELEEHYRDAPLPRL